MTPQDRSILQTAILSITRAKQRVQAAETEHKRTQRKLELLGQLLELGLAKPDELDLEPLEVRALRMQGALDMAVETLGKAEAALRRGAATYAEGEAAARLGEPTIITRAAEEAERTISSCERRCKEVHAFLEDLYELIKDQEMDLPRLTPR